jgi:hypothetical protein
MTPDKARKMTGYVRISRVGRREGVSYASPEIQRKAIEDDYLLEVIARLVADFTRSSEHSDRGLPLVVHSDSEGGVG